MWVFKQLLVNFLVWFYIYVICGMLMLVQLFLIYYGLVQFDVVCESVLWFWLLNVFFCVCLVFVINISVYIVEIFVGSLKVMFYGEIEVVKVMGMLCLKMYCCIFLLLVLWCVLLQYSNEVIMMLQIISLVFIVILVDIIGVVWIVYLQYYLLFEVFIIVGLFYLCLIFILVCLFKFVECCWLVYLVLCKF